MDFSKGFPQSARARMAIAVVLLACAAFAAYWPALTGGFLFDDDKLVTANQLVQGSHGLYRIWLTTEPIDYWPVTNTSFWLEWRLWGLHTAGYHATNLALHVASGVLIWAILRRLAIPGAWLAAFIFVLHPVNVESVAWIAQRKNTLSMMFFLLSILWYLRFDGIGAGGRSLPTVENSPNPPRKHPAARARSPQTQPAARSPQPAAGLMWYWLSLAAFILAMLSKGSVAILPLLLLLIVWWRRAAIAPRDLLRTVPFFVVAGVLTLVNIFFQIHRLGDEAIRHVTPVHRATGAAAIVWFYLSKALWPVGLIFMYPQWTITDDAKWWAALVAAIAVTALLVWQRRRPVARALLCAWAFFCVALLPVMGFTDVYYMKYALVADHYQYIAIIAIAAVAAAALSAADASASPAVARWRPVLMAGRVAVLAALFVLTWQQSHIYANAETLYRETVERNPTAWVLQYNLGVALEHGRVDEAVEHFRAAVRLNPDLVEGRENLCHAAKSAGRLDEAIAECSAALALNPNLATVQNDLGFALMSRGDFKSAAAHLDAAVRLDASLTEAHFNLGDLLLATGHAREAADQYLQTLRLAPDSAAAHNGLANALIDLGDAGSAESHLREAIRLKPRFAAAHQSLGDLLQASGRLKDAADEYRSAIQYDSRSAEAHNNLGVVLVRLGRRDEAVDHFRAALALQPDYADARANLNRVAGGGDR